MYKDDKFVAGKFIGPQKRQLYKITHILYYVNQVCGCKPTEGFAIRKCDQLRRLTGVCEVSVEDKALNTCAACCVTNRLTGCVNGLTG